MFIVYFKERIKEVSRSAEEHNKKHNQYYCLIPIYLVLFIKLLYFLLVVRNFWWWLNDSFHLHILCISGSRLLMRFFLLILVWTFNFLYIYRCLNQNNLLFIVFKWLTFLFLTKSIVRLFVWMKWKNVKTIWF